MRSRNAPLCGLFLGGGGFPPWAALLSLAVLIAGGCSQHLRPIFEEQYPDLAWPPRPARAKIRYLGQIGSSADLKAPPKLFEAIGAVLVGAPKPQRLYGPRAVLVTGLGRRVWVADSGGRRLHLFDLQDRSYTSRTRMGDAPLLSPLDLCRGPDDSIYLCDSQSVAIHRISARDGAFLESLRLPEDIRRPVALDFDAVEGELFVVDAAAHDIKVLGSDGRLLRIIGRRGGATGQFNFPCDVVCDGELIWVVDAGNNRVQGLTRQGEPVVAFGGAGDAPGDLALPKSIALDSDGHLYVVDARFENVQVFDRSGRLLLFFGQEGNGPAEFWLPAGIFIDSADRIWVCDAYNGRLQVFEYQKATESPQVPDADDQRDAGARGSGAEVDAVGNLEQREAVNP